VFVERGYGRPCRTCARSLYDPTIGDVGDDRRPVLPNRQSMRLKGFDYASSADYVVTICAHHRKPIFGSVSNGAIVLSPLGEILEEEWQRTAELRRDVVVDEFIIMPNHVHGIVILNTTVEGVRGSPGESGPARTLSAIVRGFKAACTSRARKAKLAVEFPIWQAGFYDRIIRDDAELQKFRRYIVNNPIQWELDRHFRV